MKNNEPRTHTDSTHQTVTENIKLQIGKKSIQIGFTEQRLSPLAGMLSWAGYLFKKEVPELLGRMLPHQPTTPNALPPVDIAMGFLAGVVAGADKLTRVAHLRADPLLPEVLQVERIASASPHEVDMALIYGIGFPPFRAGACRYFDQLGPAKFVELAGKYASYGKLYEPPKLLRDMAAAGKKFFG